MPILLKQAWADIAQKAHDIADWTAFRNDPFVRQITAETTTRLLDLPRQTPVVWPTKEITLYDVSTMRNLTPPVAVDGPAVMSVWQRNEDAMELRMMGGRWITLLEAGDLRGSLSAVAWTLLPTAQQGLPAPLKCASRGPASLPAKARTSPIWFWLELGRAFLAKRPGHPGWPTMHAAFAEAFRLHYKRWTSVERMRVLLAWIQHIRASLLPPIDGMWSAHPINLATADIDLPYKEIAAELADPNKVLHPNPAKKDVPQKSRSEAKMEEADAAIMAALGLSDDD